MPALKIVNCCNNHGRLTTRPFAGDDLQVVCIVSFLYRIIQMACIIPFWVRLFLFRLHGRNVSSLIDMCLCLYPVCNVVYKLCISCVHFLVLIYPTLSSVPPSLLVLRRILFIPQFVGPNGQPSWCSNDVIDPLNAIFLSTTNIAENTITNQIIIDETGSQTWQNISYEATKDGRIHGAPKDMVIPFTFYLIVSVIYTVVDIALSLGIHRKKKSGHTDGRTLVDHRMATVKMAIKWPKNCGILSMTNTHGHC